MVDTGIAKTLMETMREHNTDADIINVGMEVLNLIASNEKCCPRLVVENAMVRYCVWR